MKLFKFSFLKIALCLLFLNSCTNDETIIDCTEDVIESYLVECPWDVNTTNSDYIYTFSTDQTLSITTANNSYATTGTWSTSTNAAGQVVVTITEELGDFNDEWTFNNCDFSDLQVTSTDSTVNSIEINCSGDISNDCTEDVIESYLVECPWDVNTTSSDYIYTFSTDQTLSITTANNSYTTTGTWSTSTNAAGQIVITIVDVASDFNDDWTFTNCDINNLQVSSANSTVNTIESSCL